MTILESISTNVAELLMAQEVLDECNRQPVAERAAFMTTFAVYIEWAVLCTCRPLFSSDDCSLIASEIQKDFASQHWFSVDLYQEIAPSAKLRLDHMAPGKHIGALLPMVHAIEGANAVGHQIRHSTDAKFVMYTLAAWKFMGEQIPRLCNQEPT
jgi:hypothetical protein